ncbi:MAG: glycosyltransferase family 4 protein [Flavobacterium sp.]|nr:glycosyltransferase family 4 protein [Flavobacterium sp.]
MKIVFSTDQIYLHGGIEKVMALKANYFADVLNYEVTILTTEQNHKKPCYPLSSKVNLIDIEINYNRKKSYFHYSNLAKIPNHFKKWNAVLKQIKPDGLISCNYAFDFYWIPFFKLDVKKYKEYHSSGYFESLDKSNAGFIKKMRYKLNDFIASKYTSNIILNPDEKIYYPYKNLTVIPNPIDETPLTANLENKTIIAAGRIASVKGFDVLIKTWQLVAQKEPLWQLHIYGQGEPDYIKMLQQLIDNFQLTNQVFIKPATNNLLEVLSQHSIYVMSSNTECFPMVLLESLAVGLPIISFDCPTGPRNIITDNEDGFLVENQNCASLAEKIVFLIQNKTSRKAMGIKAKTNSLRFSTPKVMQLWQNLFDSQNLKN